MAGTCWCHKELYEVMVRFCQVQLHGTKLLGRARACQHLGREMQENVFVKSR